MEYMTIQRNISTTPRKLRLVADMVRKMTPYRALDVLQFTNKAAALPLAKAIKTVVANAGTAENLVFVKIEINEGLKMKRYRAGTAGRGRGRPYRRRMSHIKVVLSDDNGEVEKILTTPEVLPVKAVKTEKIVEEPKNEVIEGEIVEKGDEKL